MVQWSHGYIILDWFGYLHELYIDIWFTFKSATERCAICFICIDWWGKGSPMVACPFWALIVLCRMLPTFTWYKCLMYGLLFLQLATALRCFRTRTFVLKTDWTRFVGPLLHHIYTLDSGESAGVFETEQLIILVVFGAVDEPLASCVMVQF